MPSSDKSPSDRPSREQPLSRQERRRQERRREVARQQKQQERAAARSPWPLLLGALVVVLIVAGIGGYFAFGRGTTNASGDVQPGGTIDGISCQAEMLQYHHHTHLTLYQNGKPVIIPADVGIPFNEAINVSGKPYCLYFLHTHATTNVIHVESPTSQTFTLGQFFDVWHYTALWDSQSTLATSAGVAMDSSFVDALRAAKPGDIHAFVGAKPVANYRDIPLLEHEVLTLEIGSPVKPPTTSFDWNHWNGA